MRLVQEFAASLGKTKARQNIFNALGALVRQPIFYKEVLSKELIDPQEDAFSLRQGDVVSTDAAFFLGERLVGLKYAGQRSCRCSQSDEDVLAHRSHTIIC